VEKYLSGKCFYILGKLKQQVLMSEPQ